jgi:uncharacterized protein (TIGR00369 family)
MLANAKWQNVTWRNYQVSAESVRRRKQLKRIGRTMALTKISKERRYGVVSVDERRALGGLEFVQGLVTGSLPLNSMARTLGYDIAEASVGRVVVTADPSADHLNPAGTVHGGLAATLLDTCMGLAVQTTIERGFSSTTLEFKISLLRPVTPETGSIRAEGIVITSGRRIGTAEGRLTDTEGRLFAHGTTTCLIFDR